ncbi:dihydrofolate reductase family protein [Terrabacter aeriphilus]|uniref:Dihydrofolate reductase family protein n=1 Tax=Terrabacter aeriphilus TaxID=515662 RepID=A0ABP9J3L0_9MICO
MRTLTYLIASSIDGFIAGPDGGDPTGPDGFWPVSPDYLSHLLEHYPETLPVMAHEPLGVAGPWQHFDTVLEGRGSYQVGLDAGITNAYPHLRHVVFSRTLGAGDDPGVEVTADDPVTTVRRLKAEDGAGLWLVGGGTLAAALADEIDRLVVKVGPVTVGDGIPLLGRGAAFEPRAWRLLDHAVAGDTVVLTYERATA